MKEVSLLYLFGKTAPIPKIAEHFNVGKTATTTILKSEKRLREEFEFFTSDGKKRKYGQYSDSKKRKYGQRKPFCIVRKVRKCKRLSDRPVLQEEAMLLKERLNNTDF